MDVARSIMGERVVRVLDALVEERGKSSVIVVDDGRELTSIYREATLRAVRSPGTVRLAVELESSEF